MISQIHSGHLCSSFESNSFSPLSASLSHRLPCRLSDSPEAQLWPRSGNPNPCYLPHYSKLHNGDLFPGFDLRLLHIKPPCAETYTYIQCTPRSRLSASLSPPVLFLMSRVLVIRCQQVFVCSSVPEHKGGHTLDTTHTTPLFHFFNL